MSQYVVKDKKTGETIDSDRVLKQSRGFAQQHGGHSEQVFVDYPDDGLIFLELMEDAGWKAQEIDEKNGQE
jgi:hypothetical protein